MTSQMREEPFDLLLGQFLDWQATDVADAPSADEVTDRIKRSAARPAIFGGRPRQLLWVAAALLLLALAGAVVGAAVLLRNEDRVQPSPTPTLATEPTLQLSPVIGWTGPVRSDATNMPLLPARSGPEGGRLWIDDADASTAWADLTEVQWRGTAGEQPYWFLGLASKPPITSDLAPVTVLEYGVVLETTGDGVPDYEFGLNTSTERLAGRAFRVWVTNLATGTTQEQLGPPYGYPVEFRHPDESEPDDPASWARTVMFTFLDSGPPGLGSGTRYYAWASHTENGDLVSWDYAPDNGWLGFRTLVNVTVLNLTASVARSEWASLSIKTEPNATCSIAIGYDRRSDRPGRREGRRLVRKRELVVAGRDGSDARHLPA
jgi:hypothetical protein